MEKDKILQSEKVPAGKRTYFIDLMEKYNGDRVLKVTESRENDGTFIRSSILVFQEDFEKFFEAVDRMRQHL